ncbi:uncharacterized protein [Tenebrio molitor]|jgi:hypothetical protein|uniref:uncharacterized protein n=1 Tax=Tenebrio molitor TaxID=7067 RepID=UPI0036246FE3
MAKITTRSSPASGTTVTLFPDSFIDLTDEKRSEINDDDDVVLIPNTPQTSSINCTKYPASKEKLKVNIKSIQKSAFVTDTVQKPIDCLNQTRELSVLPTKTSNQLSQINFKSSGGRIMVERKHLPTVQTSKRSSWPNNVVSPKREKCVASKPTVTSKTYSKQNLNEGAQREPLGNCVLQKKCNSVSCGKKELLKKLIRAEEIDKKVVSILDDVILLSDETTKGMSKVISRGSCNEKAFKLVNTSYIVEKSQQITNLKLNTKQSINRQNKTDISSLCKIFAHIPETEVKDSEKELIRCEEVAKKVIFNDLDDVILLSDDITKAIATEEKVIRRSTFNEKTLKTIKDKIELERKKNARFDSLQVVEKSQKTPNSSLKLTLNTEQFSNRQNKSSTPGVCSPRQIITEMTESEKELIRCEEVAKKHIFDDLDDVILLSDEAATAEKVSRPSTFNEKTLKPVNDKIELENNKNARFDPLQVVEKSQQTLNSLFKPTLNSEQFSNKQNKTSTPLVSAPRKIIADIAETASAVATITPNEGHCNSLQFSNRQNKTSTPQVSSPRQVIADITEAASAVAAITPNESICDPSLQYYFVLCPLPVNYTLPSATSADSTSAINEIICLSSPEPAPEETTPVACVVSSTDADFLKKPTTEDVEIEPPAAVTPVDIMKIINEGKSSTPRELCGSEVKHRDDAPFKGFTKVERRKRRCLRDLRQMIKQIDTEMEELNKSVFRFESSFVNCGNSNEDFLPEVKSEIDELEESTNNFTDIEERVSNEIYNTPTLPTITEVISQVNEEVLELRTQWRSDQDLQAKLAKPEQALKLIKEGLELIQSWSREASSSKEKAKIETKVSDGLKRGRKKTVPIVEEEKTKKKVGRRKKTEEAKQEVNQSAKKRGRVKKGESREQCNITNVTRKSETERVTKGRKKREVEGDVSDDELLILKRVDILKGNGLITPKRYKKKR